MERKQRFDCMKQKHILVVDDEQNTLRSMEFILEAANYQVSVAKNGYEALKVLSNELKTCSPIDLIITDIQMPMLTGLKLIEKLQEFSYGIPVLIITGYGNKQLYAQLLENGYNEILDKPIEEDELLRRVKKLINNGNQPGR